MRATSRNREKRNRAQARTEDGSALLLAIFVLVLLTGMGVVLLFASRTDVRMSQADSRAKKAFYIAEAGLETAREQLRLDNLASADKDSLDDELTVAAGGDGNIDLDADALQAVYDGSGNVTGFTGYGDDVPLAGYASFGGGWYAAFLTNDPVDGKTNLNDTNSRVMITAIGTGKDRSLEMVQAIVERLPLPDLPATITVLGPTAGFEGGTSAAKTYEGDDCDGATGYTGVPGLSVPTVGTIGSASEASAEDGVDQPAGYDSGGETGIATVDNIESTIDPTWTTCSDLLELADLIKKAADYVCTVASPCTHWNTATMQTITYVEGDLTLPESSKGLLWVTGDLTINGADDFDGAILVIGEGSFAFSGGGNGHSIGGIVVANIAGPDGVFGTADDCTDAPDGFAQAWFDADGGGNHDWIYCSDALNQVTVAAPLDTMTFRQR